MLSQDVWELYHVADDFSEARDLAAQDPKELRALFITEAAKNHVLPIDTGDPSILTRLSPEDPT